MKRTFRLGLAFRIGVRTAVLCWATNAVGYSTNDVIATYAGHTTLGYSGDEGAAAAAALNGSCQPSRRRFRQSLRIRNLQ